MLWGQNSSFTPNGEKLPNVMVRIRARAGCFDILCAMKNARPILYGFVAVCAAIPSFASERFASSGGIYPHLAMFNDEGECCTGAVVPWAGDLWVVTYAPHAPTGSSDKLYRIRPDLTRETFPGSVGGTPANRMIHRETNQLLIGPYVIDAKGSVRVVSPAKMPGRTDGTPNGRAPLVSGDALVKISSRGKGDTPEDYARVSDATPYDPKRKGLFTTKAEDAPWAIVELAGDVEIEGVTVVGESKGLSFWLSDDGEEWRKVGERGMGNGERRVDLRKDSPSAKFVKVGFEPGVGKKSLSLKKILVYGKKLY